MMNKQTGGPAFPEVRIISGDNYNAPTKVYYGGMTMRDYFAAKAMQALISGGDISLLAKRSTAVYNPATHISVLAYEQADAMLKARG